MMVVVVVEVVVVVVVVGAVRGSPWLTMHTVSDHYVSTKQGKEEEVSDCVNTYATWGLVE